MLDLIKRVKGKKSMYRWVARYDMFKAQSRPVVDGVDGFASSFQGAARGSGLRCCAVSMA